MDKRKPPTAPPAVADSAPEPSEQLAADETATIQKLANIHARLDGVEMRFCFHSGYLAALHSMRSAVADGIIPDVQPGILTDAERQEVTRTVGSLLQQRRDTQTPNHPMGDTAPGWLTSCPHWCTSEHRPGEHPDDRQHTGVYYYTPLQTMDYVDYGTPGAPDWMPRDLMVALVQEYREVEPRALVMETADDVALYLTLDEARRHRDHLTELLADAAQAGGAL